MNIAVLLFNDFETLDVFGPVEIFGRLKDIYTIDFYSLNGGLITNNHGVSILTQPLQNACSEIEILIIPGGIGTRLQVNNDELIRKIKELSDVSHYIFTICTGSALAAKAGLLDNRKATSNKRAFSWVITNGPNVQWDKHARWVVDGNLYTSSGVSAGTDMALGFIRDRHGLDLAHKIALEIEYLWTEDSQLDTFKAL